MMQTRVLCIIFLLIAFLFLSACMPPSDVGTDDVLSSIVQDSLADAVEQTVNGLRVFGLEAGVSYDDSVGAFFPESELDLQFYGDSGKITLNQRLTFKETGEEKWIVSFFFQDNRLVRVAAGITFLNTPLAEASECIAVLRDAYQTRFGEEVYFLEQGPTLEDLANGDLGSWSVEWILDEGGGVRVSAKNRDDLRGSDITEHNLCLEASVIFVL